LFYNFKQRGLKGNPLFASPPLFEGGLGGFALISNIQAKAGFNTSPLLVKKRNLD
jgi:hypothetical protein